MKLQAILMSFVMVSVILAGCTDGGEETPSGEGEGGPVTLGNNGAITGLVVDDNYRPVQLKEDWGTSAPGDYQDQGFVLLMETAQRFETNENGEFTVLPLKPGTYTIRVAADNHEAIEKKVQVVAGEYSEVTMEARRTFSSGGSVLSQEQTLFMSCSFTSSAIKVALAALAAGCGDTSGDSSRFDFYTNYDAIEDDIRGMVTEMRASDDGYYSVTIRNLNYGEFGDFFVYNAKYDKIVLYTDKAFTRTGSEKAGTDEVTYRQEGEAGWCQPPDKMNSCSGFLAMWFGGRFQTALFPDHPSKYWQDTALEPAQPAACNAPDVPNPAVNDGVIRILTCDPWGNGVTLGVKAQFVQNVFLYELPEAGIEDYCTLCDDADIPE